MGIGKRIRILRERANITQEELAQQIGVTPSAVGNYEREVSHPREEVLYRLFEVLGCQPNELFADCYSAKNSAEQQLIEKYRALDSYGRELVESCADIEYRRCCESATTVAARNGGTPKRMVIRKRMSVNNVNGEE